MRIKEKLDLDLKEAMRTQDSTRRSVIRLLKAEITNAEIVSNIELDDEAILEIVGKEAKNRRDAMEEYARANRQDLVAKEQAELSIINEYLPQQMSREAIVELAQNTLSKLGVQDIAQIGLVMRELMPQVKGRADGRLVNELVREMLSTSSIG